MRFRARLLIVPSLWLVLFCVPGSAVASPTVAEPAFGDTFARLFWTTQSSEQIVLAEPALGRSLLGRGVSLLGRLSGESSLVRLGLTSTMAEVTAGLYLGYWIYQNTRVESPAQTKRASNPAPKPTVLRFDDEPLIVEGAGGKPLDDLVVMDPNQLEGPDPVGQKGSSANKDGEVIPFPGSGGGGFGSWHRGGSGGGSGGRKYTIFYRDLYPEHVQQLGDDLPLDLRDGLPLRAMDLQEDLSGLPAVQRALVHATDRIRFVETALREIENELLIGAPQNSPAELKAELSRAHSMADGALNSYADYFRRTYVRGFKNAQDVVKRSYEVWAANDEEAMEEARSLSSLDFRRTERLTLALRRLDLHQRLDFDADLEPQGPSGLNGIDPELGRRDDALEQNYAEAEGRAIDLQSWINANH